MVRILKNGRQSKPLKRIYHVVCPTCGCEFECESSDFTSQERGLDGHATINCPECGQFIKFVPNSWFRFEEQAEPTVESTDE